MLPVPVAEVVDRFLARLDRAVPGAVAGFYVVGSVALGGFRAGRSDIDFVATLDRPLMPADLSALRSAHRWSWTGSVTWWTLAHRGIAVRGLPPGQMDIHLDDAGLRAWTAANLASYWRPWAAAVAGGGPRAWRVRLTHLHARRLAAWGVLGTARMHATIRYGTVISKEQAGEYALDVFDADWHPVIRDALAYWRGLPPLGRTSRVLRAETAAFVSHVIDVAGSTAAPDRS